MTSSGQKRKDETGWVVHKQKTAALASSLHPYIYFIQIKKPTEGNYSTMEISTWSTKVTSTVLLVNTRICYIPNELIKVKFPP